MTRDELPIDKNLARWDKLMGGSIQRKTTKNSLPQEIGDETEHLPRLVFYYNRRDAGKLYQMISTINQMGAAAQQSAHPLEK